jgi:GT2 family glycosyltransferase
VDVELSVILPCHNGAPTIEFQLDALCRQEWSGSWELVVVDNRSTDGTRAIVERYRDRLPALHVVEASEKAGLPYACNVGMRTAAGKAAVFCNHDDEVAPGWLAAMGEALRRDEFVAGRLEHDRLNEPWAIEVRGRLQVAGLVESGFGRYLPFAFGCTLGVLRSRHDAIGGFDESLVPAAEDMDYCWRLQLAGSELRFVPDAVTHYRLRHNLRAIYRQGRNYGLGDVLVYKKHRRLGMPPAPHPLATGIRKWIGLVKLFALAWNKTRLALALWHLGLRTGRLRGSIDQRILFP